MKSLSFAVITALSIFAVAQEPKPTQPWPGLKLYTYRASNPINRIYVAVIDLRNKKIHVRVARGGPDPDGAGQWQTTLMTPTAIAKRDHMDFVINGDFFRIPKATDAEGALSPYKAKLAAAVIGPAVTDGKVWSKSKTPRPSLVVTRSGKAFIKSVATPSPKDYEVVSGNIELLKDGEVLPHENQARHPRTAVGLTEKGSKLVLVVVDGRKPGISEGMSYDELAAEMKQLGCWQAINLDGGGSSVMAYRSNPKDDFLILNQPTDGHERPVANVLGIRYGSFRVEGRNKKPRVLARHSPAKWR